MSGELERPGIEGNVIPPMRAGASDFTVATASGAVTVTLPEPDNGRWVRIARANSTIGQVDLVRIAGDDQPGDHLRDGDRLFEAQPVVDRDGVPVGSVWVEQWAD